MLFLKIALLIIGCAVVFVILWAKTNAMDDPDWPRIEDMEEGPDPLFGRDQESDMDDTPSLFV